MNLNKEDREWLCIELVHLCIFEMKEAMDQRLPSDMTWKFSPTRYAIPAKYSAEQRLRILPLLEIESDDLEEHLYVIQKCIERLDGFIDSDPYAEWEGDE